MTQRHLFRKRSAAAGDSFDVGGGLRTATACLLLSFPIHALDQEKPASPTDPAKQAAQTPAPDTSPQSPTATRPPLSAEELYRKADALTPPADGMEGVTVIPDTLGSYEYHAAVDGTSDALTVWALELESLEVAGAENALPSPPPSPAGCTVCLPLNYSGGSVTATSNLRSGGFGSFPGNARVNWSGDIASSDGQTAEVATDTAGTKIVAAEWGGKECRIDVCV